MDLHEIFLVSQIIGKNNKSGMSVDLSDYYTKSQTNDLISDKVDKISGMGLSANSFTDAEKSKLAGLKNYDDTQIKSEISALESQTNKLLSGKVNKVTGMGLSVNCFTDAEKSKLAGLKNYDDTQIKSEISMISNKKYLNEQSIPSGADLNDYISENFQVYCTGSQAITQTILNKPSDVNDNRFTLETWKNGSFNYIQRLTHCAYTAVRPPVIYIRSCSGGSSSMPDLTWSDWYKFTPVKV